MATVYHKIQEGRRQGGNSRSRSECWWTRVDEQVLLMTCRVKVTAADGSSTIASALIDPGSPASFIHEWLAQHLHLPQYTYMRFHMVPGVWHWGRCKKTVGVEVYVLIEEDNQGSTPASYSGCPQVGPLIGSKLADSDFRTPTRIDLLLRAEVFMSILCDSRQNGPWGTSSTINTCFGWVLFEKTQGIKRCGRRG